MYDGLMFEATTHSRAGTKQTPEINIMLAATVLLHANSVQCSCALAVALHASCLTVLCQIHGNGILLSLCFSFIAAQRVTVGEAQPAVSPNWRLSHYRHYN